MSILEGSVTGSVAGSLQLNGEGGTDNYQELINKPQINGVTLIGNKDSEDLFIIKDVYVNGVSVVDGQLIARITIPPTPTIPVQNVLVNGQSAMVGTTAEINIPPAPNVPVQDVQVNSQSVVVGGIAEITIPPTPTIPVTDVEVNNASVVSGTVAEIEIPVLDVKVDGVSVVDLNGDANISLPTVPVQGVEVDGIDVEDADGIAQISLPTVPVQGVEVDGIDVVDADGIAQISLPVIPTIPVTDVKVNGSSVMSGTVANIVLVASDVSYDNTNSGYTASQTQDAIDEAASKISDNSTDITDLQTNVGDFSTPLDTTAQDCHDAINELKQSLTDLIKISTCTVMGNGTKYANNDVTAITGYTAIGIVGYDPSGSFVAGYELAGLSVNISAQKVYATWGVDLGSNAGIIAKVLYVRNGSAS